MLQPPELSYLQRLPLCVCKRWYSYRASGSNTIDRGKHVGRSFDRFVQCIKTIAKFLDGKFEVFGQEKFLSIQGRPFAALRVTMCISRQTLRCAQGDNVHIKADPSLRSG